jgi:hypothetical protein
MSHIWASLSEVLVMQIKKPIDARPKVSFPDRALEDNELDAVPGGSFHFLSSSSHTSISAVGLGLETMARKG